MLGALARDPGRVIGAAFGQCELESTLSVADEAVKRVRDAAKQCAVPEPVLAASSTDVDAKDDRGSSALMYASFDGDINAVRVLIQAGANLDAASSHGVTALMVACAKGHAEIAKALVEAGADRRATTNEGRTAADAAIDSGHPGLVALCDPEVAARMGQELHAAFDSADLVHVISTRYCKAKAEPTGSCGPIESARAIKKELEWHGQEAGVDVCVFNPNSDNAFLMPREGESPEGDHLSSLRSWREVGLKRARETGGRVIQLVVKPGLSEQQKLEADMAADWGVPIVRVEALYQTPIQRRLASDGPTDMKTWAEVLTGLAEAVARGESLSIPQTREEMRAEIERQRNEIEKLVRVEMARRR